MSNDNNDSDDFQKSVNNFYDNTKDFGTSPSPVKLTDDQRKIAVQAMAMNAAMIQFINEGLLRVEDQLHFVGHFQDFAQRLYEGEAIKLNGAKQTLAIDSEAGYLFHRAAEIAFKQGKETLVKIKEAYAEADKYMQETETENKEQTNARPKYLN